MRSTTSAKKPRTTRRRASSSGMPARLQVEQLQVVETSRRAGVARRRRSRRSRSRGWAPSRRARRRTAAGCGSSRRCRCRSRPGGCARRRSRPCAPTRRAARSCTARSDVQFGRGVVDVEPALEVLPAPAKLTPSSSACPPGPAKRTVGTMRTTDAAEGDVDVPVGGVAADQRGVGRQLHRALVRGVARRRPTATAPSPITNSTFAATWISPRWSMTSVARAFAPTSTTWWAYERPLTPPTAQHDRLGRARHPASTRTCSPRRACAIASALTRSAGVSAVPNAASGRRVDDVDDARRRARSRRPR